jgi:hypothetical protein
MKGAHAARTEALGMHGQSFAVEGCSIRHRHATAS